MIYSELRNYLVGAASPEVVQTFDAAVAVFDKYGMVEYMDMFDAVTFEDPGANDTAVLDMLQLNLRTVLEHLLDMHGVQVHEHVLTSQVAELADGLYDIVNYEDRATVLETLNAYDGAELASELLVFVTPYTSDELMGFFLTVEDSFGERVSLRIQGPTPEDQEHLENVERQVRAYAGFKSVVGEGPIYSDRLFAHVSAIGLEYSAYLKLYQGDHEGQDLASKKPEDIAKDLVGMAILSSDGVTNPLITVRKHLNDLFGDINVVTKINVAVSNLTVEVAHAQA